MLSFLIPSCSYAAQACKDSYSCNLPNQIKQNISKNSGHAIQKQFQAFLKNQGIRQDLIFLEHNSWFGMFGTNLITKCDAGVFVPPFYSQEHNLRDFLIRREISHIKYNRSLFINLVPAIVAVISAAICRFNSRSGFEAILIGISVARLAQNALGKVYNGLADNFAISNGEIHELQAAEREFTHLKIIKGASSALNPSTWLDLWFYEHRIEQIKNTLARLKQQRPQ